MRNDWTPEQVRTAIHGTGLTMAELARRNGFSSAAVRLALKHRLPRVQAVIGFHLGLSPQEIWPSRYQPNGMPIRKLRAPNRQTLSRNEPSGHRQKERAA